MITITIIIIIDEICHLIINIYTLNYDFGKGVRSLLNKIMQGNAFILKRKKKKSDALMIPTAKAKLC